MKKEQKFFIIILIFYWVGIFIATHIPVPDWIRQMRMSDKTMHFAAYMILSILLWFSTSFGIKADWRKLRPWLLLAIVILYAAVDETSQHFIHRSIDILDFASNILGAAAAMLIASFLSAYNAVMILITICPIFAPALAKSKLIPEGSILEYAAYTAGFMIITTAWVIYLSSIFSLNLKRIKCIPIFFAPPAGTVLLIKIYAQLTDKPFSTDAILISFASIILTLFTWKILSKDKAAI